MPSLMTLAMNKPGRVYCMKIFCRRFKQSAQTIVSTKQIYRAAHGNANGNWKGSRGEKGWMLLGETWEKHNQNESVRHDVMTSSIIGQGPVAGSKSLQILHKKTTSASHWQSWTSLSHPSGQQKAKGNLPPSKKLTYHIPMDFIFVHRK